MNFSKAAEFKKKATSRNVVELFSAEKNPHRELIDWIGCMFAVIAMMAAGTLAYGDFQPDLAEATYIGVSAFTLIVFQLLGYRRLGAQLRTAQKILAAVLGLLAIALISFMFPQVWGGFASMVNEAIARINGIYESYLPYWAGSNASVSAAIMFSGVLGLVAGLLCSYLMQRKSRILLPLLLVGIVLYGHGVSVSQDYVEIGLACIGFIAYWYFQSGSKAAYGPIAQGFAFAVIVALLTFLLCLNYAPLSKVDQARDQFGAGVAAVRYGSDSLPEGHVFDSASMTIGNDDCLRITSDEPVDNDILMRGYVGCTWTGTDWKPISDKAFTGDWQGMMQWLQRQKFDPQTQVADYNKVLLDAAEVNNWARVSVNNDNSSRKYLYTTYDAANISASYETNHDAQKISTGLFGKRAYEFDAALQNPERSLTEEVTSLSSFEENGTSTYFDDEQVYRAFVYDHYLDVSDADKQLINRLFFDSESFDETNPSAYSIASRIRLILQMDASYDVTVSGSDGGNGFLDTFLMREHRGNSACFATAAVMAFRTQGIPARYAEGYRVAAGSFEQQDDSYVATAGAVDAHAWVEIYRDGLGWIPVEVTPGFYTELYTSSTVIPVNRNTEGGIQKDPAQGLIAGDVDQDDANKNRAALPSMITVLLAVLGIIAAFMLLALGGLELQRAMRLHSLENRKTSADQQIQVRAWFDDIALSLTAAGIAFDKGRPEQYTEEVTVAFPDVWSEEYNRVLEVTRKSLFGCRELKPHEMKTLTGFAERIAANVPHLGVKQAVLRRYRYLR